MRLTVIGTGYVGAVHAACMADIGHDVLGVDVDADKIGALAGGHPPFYEPCLPELLDRTVRSGRLRFTTSFAEASEFGQVHFVCVGTPQAQGSQAADLRHLDAAFDNLAAHLRDPCLIVGKSTVPVGTAARLSGRLRDGRRGHGGRGGAEVAWNPEFLREGYAVHDTLHPVRLVVGVQTPGAEETLRDLYGPIVRSGARFISTDPTTAELVKMASNSFLATKISFINAMAELCDACGADIVTLADAIGDDPRIGHPFLSAGLGFGGSCLPKDIRALGARARELGVGTAVEFLRQIDEINMRQRRRTIETARVMLGGTYEGRNVTVLGAAFKPDSDDVRDSPALDVAEVVRGEGAHVTVHDPEALENARAAFPDLDYEGKLVEACAGADLVLHLTDWDEYRRLDPAPLAQVVAQPRVLDARNSLDRARWQQAGWTIHALGRPTVDAGPVGAEAVAAGPVVARSAGTGSAGASVV